MNKSNQILFLVLFTIKGLAQNNPIYFSGIGGNISSSQYQSPYANKTALSGIGGGWEASNFSQSFDDNLNKSGASDAWSSASFFNNNSNLIIYKSTTGDGYATASKSQINKDTTLFKSGIGDTWASKNYLQINKDTILFKSSLGDGWVVSKYATQSDTGLFKSGVGDGWVKQDVVLPSVPLPLNLTRFEGAINDTKDDLNWETQYEVNTSHFVVEHSRDGLRFLELGMVTAYNNSAISNQYSFTNKKPKNGNNFYRLKMIDLDGKFVYSSIIVLTRTETNFSIIAFPNPTAEFLNIKLANQSDETSIIIHDASGKFISSKVLPKEVSDTSVDLTNCTNGYLFVTIKNESTSKTIKILKIK